MMNFVEFFIYLYNLLSLLLEFCLSYKCKQVFSRLEIGIDILAIYICIYKYIEGANDGEIEAHDDHVVPEPNIEVNMER